MADALIRNVIRVEQLNRSQWHTLLPTGGGYGVTNYVEAIAYALLVGTIEGWAVETVDLDGEHRLMALTWGGLHG